MKREPGFNRRFQAQLDEARRQRDEAATESFCHHLNTTCPDAAAALRDWLREGIKILKGDAT